MTRDEHLKWSKTRALEYLDAGDIRNAITSMMSDLSKHEDFQGSTYDMLNVLGIRYAITNDQRGARSWIEGFN